MMKLFGSCLRPAGIAAQALFLAALGPAQISVLAQPPSATQPDLQVQQEQAGTLTLPPGIPAAHPADMESLLRDARMRSAGAMPPAQATPSQGPSRVSPMLAPHQASRQTPSLIPPLAPSLQMPLDPEAEPAKEGQPDNGQIQGADSEVSGEAEQTMTPPEDAGARPGSFFLGTIRQSGFFELIIHEGALYALQNNGSEILLPQSVRALPILGSDLSYVTISAAQEQALGVPAGLYILAGDGSEIAFLKSAHAEHCKALYLSPDGKVLAVDMGGNINHHLFLLSWPSREYLDVELRYYPGEAIEIAQKAEMERRAAKAAEEAERALAEKNGARAQKKNRKKAHKSERERLSLADRPLVWHSGHGLVYRILNTDTARPCGYEPCGVVSVRSWYPHEDGASERVLCAGTELCDCAMDDLFEHKGAPLARVSMQCTRNIGEWRTRADKKTSLTMEVPVR